MMEVRAYRLDGMPAVCHSLPDGLQESRRLVQRDQPCGNEPAGELHCGSTAPAADVANQWGGGAEPHGKVDDRGRRVGTADLRGMQCPGALGEPRNGGI